jgi:uncharacterized protein YyaL (SSP411 family)
MARMNTTNRLKNHRPWRLLQWVIALALAPALLAASPPAHTNHLAGEKSPYLLQHAHNPVDWYPWEADALARARAENKPIFLSIGYAACHWCHVMEHESFENEEIAALLNRWFVCIKVDREERPDLDAIYMAAVQAMTGSGGWPLTLFLTPDLQPFFGGTYFPPVTRGGQIGLRDLLPKLHELWVSEPERPRAAAAQLTAQLRKVAATQPGMELPDRSVFDRFLGEARAAFDDEHGGFGRGPKFPPALDLSLWMRIQWRKGHPESLPDEVRRTLDAMAAGGLYDHVGGGFHRYTVDRAWRVPHFEKMLYTNALLVRTYLEAFQVTGDPAYEQVVRETCDYVLREMTDPAGGFYSAQDADSGGEEGRFYLWTPAELEAVLGKDDAALFASAFDVTPAGNFEGHRSILHRVADDATLAERFHTDAAAVTARLRAARSKLLAARGQRERPRCDEKVLAAWNGLMIGALAQAAQVLDEPRYRAAAAKAAEFILAHQRRDGALLRRWAGGEAAVPALLSDYAFLVHGLLDLYEATFDLRWLTTARDLGQEMVTRFVDPAGGFFDTDGSDPTLLLRTKQVYDGGLPSGNAVACLDLLRLAEYFGDEQLRGLAEKTLRAFHATITETPRAVPHLLQALDFLVNGAQEVVIAGPSADPRTRSLLATARRTFVPARVVALTSSNDAVAATIPWAEQRVAIDGKPTAYVCRNSMCLLPAWDDDTLRRQLQSRPRRSL